MAKDENKKRRFKGGAGRNAAKQSRGAQYGHLNLPKGVSVFKEEPKSRVDLDIIPYVVTSGTHLDRDDEYGIAVPGELWYKRPYYLHRNIGTDNNSVVCPSSNKQKCPICEYRAQLIKDGASWDDDTVKALKPSLRNLYVVIPKGSKDHDEKPHIWDISQFLFQAKLNEEIGENEEYDMFPDLEEGLTLRIRFSEESLGTNKFADTSRIDFQERKKPYSESILEKIPALDDILSIQPYKTIAAQFFGNLSEDEVEDLPEEEEDTPKEETPRRRRRPDPEPEEEEEEQESDEEEEEEEEEEEKEEKEKPKPRRGKPEEKKPGKNKCPHNHVFGKDHDAFDECEDCDLWDSCYDAGGK
jgi:hypothetical protein